MEELKVLVKDNKDHVFWIPLQKLLGMGPLPETTHTKPENEEPPEKKQCPTDVVSEVHV